MIHQKPRLSSRNDAQPPNKVSAGHRILPLSAEAISQIHSSKHITSLQGVVLSLLENSLDANATKISINVDWRRGGCAVDDDGTGISTSDFAENGGLGHMYCTSKRAPVGSGTGQSNETHGSTGTFLAELAAMSLFSITSTHHVDRRSANLTMHQGKVIARSVEDVHASENLNFRVQTGTVVTVRDLFGNMPVRVKQRALALESGADEEKSWQELKQGIVGLLLAWPKPCAIKVRDANNDARVLNVAGQHPSTSTALTSKSLNQLAGRATKYDLRDALPILFQSGLAPVESKIRWVPLSASTSSVSLKGLVCLDPAPSRRCQFIALGIHPCSPTSGQNEMYELVNKTFTNSSFGSIEDNASHSVQETPTHGKQVLSRQMQPRKGIDRFPMYYIQLQLENCSGDSSDFDRMNESSLKALTDVLEAAVSAWLERNHFRPKKRRRRTRVAQDSTTISIGSSSRPFSGAGPKPQIRDSAQVPEMVPAGHDDKAANGQTKRRKVIDLTEDSPPPPPPPPPPVTDTPLLRNQVLDFGNLSNIRIGQTIANNARPVRLEAAKYETRDIANTRATFQGLSMTPCKDSSKSPSRQNQHDDRLIASEDFGSIDDADLIAAGERRDASDDPSVNNEVECRDDSLVDWIDPATKQIYRVNSRTGVVLPPESARNTKARNQETGMPLRRRAGIETTLSSAGKPISLARRSALAKRTSVENLAHSAIPEALQGWSNPVFARQREDRIPVASIHGPGVLEMDEHGRCCLPSHSQDRFCSNGASSSSGMKLSRAALEHATVIRQVDEKFVLCKMPSAVGDANPATRSHDSKQTLLLIDQHAASERIILEGLLAKLCIQDKDSQQMTIQTASLSTQTVRAKPFVFEVSDREHELFSRYREHFEVWGMIYDLVSKVSNTSDGTSPSRQDYRIVVKDLPAVVAERCANLPALCIEMLRTELWELANGTKRPVISLSSKIDNKEGSSRPWLSILPLLPAGLRDMLYSRSCRSAIMFNDILKDSDCEKMLRDLSQCVFPFICAHGRTSMVPLTELDADDRSNLGVAKSKAVDDEKENTLRRELVCDTNSLATWMKER